MNLTNTQQFIKDFSTKLCSLYLSPMKPVINLSKSFHVGLISKFSSQSCALYGNQISAHPIAYLQNILNVYNTFYPQIQPYVLIKCV